MSINRSTSTPKVSTEQSALTQGSSRTSKALVRIDEDMESRKRSVSRRLAFKIECAKAKAFRAFSFDGEYTADKTTRTKRVWPTRFAAFAALALSVTTVAFVFEVHLGSESTPKNGASTDSAEPESDARAPNQSEPSNPETNAEGSGGSTESAGSTGETPQTESKKPPATAAAVPTSSTGRSDPPVTPPTGSTGSTEGATPSTGASAKSGLDLSIHIDAEAKAGSDTE